jgi:hypothetical protein
MDRRQLDELDGVRVVQALGREVTVSVEREKRASVETFSPTSSNPEAFIQDILKLLDGEARQALLRLQDDQSPPRPSAEVVLRRCQLIVEDTTGLRRWRLAVHDRRAYRRRRSIGALRHVQSSGFGRAASPAIEAWVGSTAMSHFRGLTGGRRRLAISTLRHSAWRFVCTGDPTFAYSTGIAIREARLSERAVRGWRWSLPGVRAVGRVPVRGDRHDAILWVFSFLTVEDFNDLAGSVERAWRSGVIPKIRRCECGCGAELPPGSRPNRRTIDGTHRKRRSRKAREAQLDNQVWTS